MAARRPPPENCCRNSDSDTRRAGFPPGVAPLPLRCLERRRQRCDANTPGRRGGGPPPQREPPQLGGPLCGTRCCPRSRERDLLARARPRSTSKDGIQRRNDEALWSEAQQVHQATPQFAWCSASYTPEEGAKVKLVVSHDWSPRRPRGALGSRLDGPDRTAGGSSTT